MSYSQVLLLGFAGAITACGSGATEAPPASTDADAVATDASSDTTATDGQTDTTKLDTTADTATALDTTVEAGTDAADTAATDASAKGCIDCMNVSCSDLHARCVAFKSCPFLDCALACKTVVCIKDCDKKFVGGDTQAEALSCMTGACVSKCAPG